MAALFSRQPFRPFRASFPAPLRPGQKDETQDETGKPLRFFFTLQPAYLLGFPVLPENRIRHLGQIRLSVLASFINLKTKE